MNALTKKIGFIQLSDPDGIRALSALYAKAPSSTPGHLFLLMMQMMDESNGLVATQTILAGRLGVSRPTIISAVKYLEANKYISVYKSGNSNVYMLNASLVWKEKSDKKYEAELYCKVLLSLDDQTEEVKKTVVKSRQMKLV